MVVLHIKDQISKYCRNCLQFCMIWIWIQNIGTLDHPEDSFEYVAACAYSHEKFSLNTVILRYHYAGRYKSRKKSLKIFKIIYCPLRSVFAPKVTVGGGGAIKMLRSNNRLRGRVAPENIRRKYKYYKSKMHCIIR